jgi:hypothetical protein
MFWKELYDLRNKILQERADEKNKYDVEQFTLYLRDLLLKDKLSVQESFRHYVRNSPSRNTYSIERTYEISKEYANGFRIFFGFFGRDYISDFIKNIIAKEYCGFSINMKNISEKDDLKVHVNYFIDFTKIDKDIREC